MDTTCFRVHADTVPEDAPPGMWADTAAKLLGIAANEIERLKEERLLLDQRIHNQRQALRENWQIIEMRAQHRRAWYPSKLLRSLLNRPRATNIPG